jgi:methylated-DNA-[protein]-cysteine S-methyltransferase
LFFYTILKFPLGRIFLAKRNKGLSFATFVRDESHLRQIIQSFKKKGFPLRLDESRFLLETKLFSRYFRGDKEDFTSLSLDLISGTPYQKKVWLEARKIPFGQVKSYKFLAEKFNHKGYRSIGQAIGQNPLLIVVPCHRVIRADGTLGGFGAGLEVKEFLLRLEGISFGVRS